MRITNKNILILLASVISGISLSLFSLNYSRVVNSQPVDYCLGPAVPMSQNHKKDKSFAYQPSTQSLFSTEFECPKIPLEEITGYPLTVERTYYIYDFEDEIVSLSNTAVKSTISNYSLAYMIINSLILIISSFLLLSGLAFIYTDINNMFIKKSSRIIVNITSILLPLLFSVRLYSVNLMAAKDWGPKFIDTPSAISAFIIWVLPIIFIYNMNQFKSKNKRMIPTFSSMLIMVCWFYIIVESNVITQFLNSALG